MHHYYLKRFYDNELLSTPIKTALNTITQQLDTPYFVYDLDQLNTHLARLVAHTDVKLWYALKANPLSK
ncbi:hypothetical protein V6257_20815, partial [Pseudoalteromonas issachenkonii]